MALKYIHRVIRSPKQRVPVGPQHGRRKKNFKNVHFDLNLMSLHSSTFEH